MQKCQIIFKDPVDFKAGIYYNAKDAISAHLKFQSAPGPAPPELKETIKEIWNILPGQFETIPNEYDDNAGLLTGTEILPLS
uniref:Uncharacterized protein n=1 Tax=Romanomermis culicivorax TaxID=13658 RepID=A0A915J9S5_ROMCU